MRVRGVKVILLGHVPPAYAGKKMNWLEGCWQKYALWMRQFRDVVVGSVYGHMNIDHFILQDFADITIAGADGGMLARRDGDFGRQSDEGDAGDVTDGAVAAAAAASGNDSLRPAGGQYTDPDELILNNKGRAKYLNKLRKQWSKLPLSRGDPPDDESDKKRKKREAALGGPFGERYGVSLVSPSIIPNYYPTIRVIEYNISGLESAAVWQEQQQEQEQEHYAPAGRKHRELECDPESFPSAADEVDAEKRRKKRKHKKKKKHARPPFEIPEPPTKTSLPGPGYSNQPLTWLRIKQYYANITKIEEEAEAQSLAPPAPQGRTKPNQGGGKEHGEYPANFQYELLYDTSDERDYDMDDLTVMSYLRLAKRIGKGYKKEQRARAGAAETSPDAAAGDSRGVRAAVKKNELWRTFVYRAFVGMYEVEDLEQIIP
ncbi:Endopolyphosphatase [Ascosphaera acerosa]|nr:Endopolyphosphatase [Ascosphaera acerosa]